VRGEKDGFDVGSTGRAIHGSDPPSSAHIQTHIQKKSLYQTSVRVLSLKLFLSDKGLILWGAPFRTFFRGRA
jgi:hypothetical protein